MHTVPPNVMRLTCGGRASATCHVLDFGTYMTVRHRPGTAFAKRIAENRHGEREQVLQQIGYKLHGLRQAPNRTVGFTPDLARVSTR